MVVVVRRFVVSPVLVIEEMNQRGFPLSLAYQNRGAEGAGWRGWRGSRVDKLRAAQLFKAIARAQVLGCVGK